MEGEPGITCRLDYVKEVPGIIKMIEILCDLLAVILCASAPTIDGSSGNKGFFLFVSILSLIITVVLFIAFILNVRNTCAAGYWTVVELIWCIFIALFYFIASIVIAVIASNSGTYGAATFFGFAAFIAYVAEAIYYFMKWRQGSSGTRADNYRDDQAQYPPTNQAPYPPAANRPPPTY